MTAQAVYLPWGISRIIHAHSHIAEIYGHVTGLPRNELGMKAKARVRTRLVAPQTLPSKWR